MKKLAMIFGFVALMVTGICVNAQESVEEKPQTEYGNIYLNGQYVVNDTTKDYTRIAVTWPESVEKSQKLQDAEALKDADNVYLTYRYKRIVEYKLENGQWTGGAQPATSIKDAITADLKKFGYEGWK